MPKKIAIQKGLENIKGRLESLGYEIVNINSGESADAIIYMADGHDISYYNQMINMDTGEDMSTNNGTLLINATGKTIEEIDYMINNRLYSPLFE